MSEPIAYILERQCNACGEMFEVRIDWEIDKIITKCLYGGEIRFGIGMWAAYRMEKDSEGGYKFTRCIPLWKYVYYRLKDYKRLLFHQYKDVEYWECPKCLKERRKRASRP